MGAFSRTINRRSTALAVAVLAAFFTVPMFQPSVIHADVGLPAWWNGKVCDTTNYPGSYQLSSSSTYYGVIACGPGVTQGGTRHPVSFTSGAWGEYEWECVELSMRYLYQVYGIAPYSADGDTVVSNYSGSILTKVNNDGTSLPSPGDVFSEAATEANGTGHTGIITKVSVTNGNGTVTIVDQNDGSDNGSTTISVVNGVLQSGVTGWLHDPNGTTISTDTLVGSGVVTLQSSGFTEAFAEGPNHSLLEYYDTPGQSWSAAVTVAGNNTTYSAPSAVIDQSTGFTQVVAEGPNNSLDNYWDTPGQPWNAGTADTSGTTYSAPAAVYVHTSGQIQVFNEGPGNSLKSHWDTQGNAWNAQSNVGGSNSTYSAPAAVVNQSTGFTQVLAEGPSNSLDNYWDTPGNRCFP